MKYEFLILHFLRTLIHETNKPVELYINWASALFPRSDPKIKILFNTVHQETPGVG